MGTPEYASGAREEPAPIAVSPARRARPWGTELTWARTEDYAGRILEIAAGKGIGLRLHEEEDRTLFLLEGRISLDIGPGVNSLATRPVAVGEAFRIRPGTLYEIRAGTDARVLEVSGPALDDVVRIRELAE